MRTAIGRQWTLSAVAALVSGLCLAGCTDAGQGTTTATASRPSTTASTQPRAPDPAVAREQALVALLDARAEAVLAKDRAAFAATLDSTRSGFGLRQLQLFENLTKLPLGSFTYGTPEPAPALGPERARQIGPDAWVAKVGGRYTLHGFDTVPRAYESHFTVVRRGDRWLLADDADGGTQAQLWDLPRMAVARGRTTLVVGSGTSAALRSYVALGDRALAQVAKTWREPWAGRLVLVVPSGAGQMAAQLGQQEADVEQVAAVTDGPIGADGRGGADRVVINPQAFRRLAPLGRQVVVTHEVTHVAIRATTNRPVPLWLSEGMADFVGYQDVGLGPDQIAAALLARVRAGQGPNALPGASDFDPTQSTIAPSYNAAWLAVRLIAERYGVERLARFYKTAATMPDPADGPGDADANTRAAFSTVLRTSEVAFVRSWLAYLDRLAA